jgi:hypothetical protein
MKITSLIAAVLLISTGYAQQKVERLFLRDSVEHTNFTRRYSSYALAFKSPLCCDPDTIYISVLSDSVDVDRQTFALFAYFPMNFNVLSSVMLLNYEDGTNEILYQPGFPDKNNYVEYLVTSKNYREIFNKRVKSITIRGIGTFKVKDRSFFINFHRLTE